MFNASAAASALSVLERVTEQGKVFSSAVRHSAGVPASAMESFPVSHSHRYLPTQVQGGPIVYWSRPDAALRKELDRINLKMRPKVFGEESSYEHFLLRSGGGAQILQEQGGGRQLAQRSTHLSLAQPAAQRSTITFGSLPPVPLPPPGIGAASRYDRLMKEWGSSLTTVSAASGSKLPEPQPAGQAKARPMEIAQQPRGIQYVLRQPDGPHSGLPKEEWTAKYMTGAVQGAPVPSAESRPLENVNYLLGEQRRGYKSLVDEEGSREITGHDLINKLDHIFDKMEAEGPNKPVLIHSGSSNKSQEPMFIAYQRHNGTRKPYKVAFGTIELLKKKFQA